MASRQHAMAWQETGFEHGDEHRAAVTPYGARIGVRPSWRGCPMFAGYPMFAGGLLLLRWLQFTTGDGNNGTAYDRLSRRKPSTESPKRSGKLLKCLKFELSFIHA